LVETNKIERQLKQALKELDDANQKEFDVTKESQDLRAEIGGLATSSVQIEKEITMLDDQLKTQNDIKDEYQSKLVEAKELYNLTMGRINKGKADNKLKLFEVEDKLKIYLRQQQELYFMMQITKGNSLDHVELYNKGSIIIESENVRRIILSRFFPQINKDREQTEEAKKKFSNSYSKISVQTIKMALEKVRDKLDL